ncbi:MAG: glycosyltransferase family 4 protein [Crocinitomicaceae bacterium]|nr:glycosyltransferase family 4 protein [Crocinitomicaceae bacterium]
MKVLTVQNIEGVAGSEKYFLALLPALIEKGVDCTVYCVYKKENLAGAQQFFDLLDALKIPYILHEANSYGSLSIPKKIANTYKQENFDIIHCHLIYADFWGAMIKKFYCKKAKVISTKHGYHESTYVKYCIRPEELPRNLYSRLFKFTHKQMDHSYACSYGLVDFYERAKLIKKGSMDVIQHGFDYPEIGEYDQSKYRFSALQLIIVGRLIERKGHHMMFEIMPQLIQKYPELKLVILGNGELEGQLKQLAKSLNIEYSIEFLGFKNEVELYLAASDIAVVPSYSEGLPLVIFEAFNAKVPVVTFDAIGCNELVENGKSGLIAEAFSKDDLRFQIHKLIENEALRKELGQNGYDRLKGHFSLNRMVKDTLAYYELVLKG